MRTEKEINDEIAAHMAARHEKGDNITFTEDRACASKAGELRDELAALLGAGAKDCPSCKTAPHAMLKTPAHTHKGVDQPPIYEVGCSTGCKLDTNEPARTRATTPEMAVKRWNSLIETLKPKG